MIEDSTEIAPCGHRVDYSIDSETDIITYSRFDVTTLSDHFPCIECSWKGLCPEASRSRLDIQKAEISRALDLIEDANHQYPLAATHADLCVVQVRLSKILKEISENWTYSPVESDSRVSIKG